MYSFSSARLVQQKVDSTQRSLHGTSWLRRHRDRLGTVFVDSAAGAIICHLLANGSPRSDVARRLRKREREVLSDRPKFYEPENAMLSEYGLVMRARAAKFGRPPVAHLRLGCVGRL